MKFEQVTRGLYSWMSYYYLLPLFTLILSLVFYFDLNILIFLSLFYSA